MEVIKDTKEYKDIEEYLEIIGTKDTLLGINSLNIYICNNSYSLYYRCKGIKLIDILFIYINKNDNFELFIKRIKYYIDDLFINYCIYNSYNEINLSLKLIYIFYKNIYIYFNTVIFDNIIKYDSIYNKFYLDLISYLYKNNINYTFYNIFYYVYTNYFNDCISNLSQLNILSNNYMDFYNVFNLIETSLELRIKYYKCNDYITKLSIKKEKNKVLKDTIIQTIINADNRGMSINRILWMYVVYRGIIKRYSCFDY